MQLILFGLLVGSIAGAPSNRSSVTTTATHTHTVSGSSHLYAYNLSCNSVCTVACQGLEQDCLNCWRRCYLTKGFMLDSGDIRIC